MHLLIINGFMQTMLEMILLHDSMNNDVGCGRCKYNAELRAGTEQTGDGLDELAPSGRLT